MTRRSRPPQRWSRSLLTLYRSMRVCDLQLLRDAFELDAQRIDVPVTRAFCARRIQVIDQVLQEKGV